MKLMTHTVAWYPDLNETEKLLLILDKYSHYIELQIPYSDPIADWPIITNAGQCSLNNWFKVSDTFKLLNKLKWKLSAEILIMTYWNIVYKYWIKEFIKDSVNAWVSGFIIPDVSPENFWEFFTLANKYKLKVVSIFAPTSSQERMQKLSKYSPDLVYAVSRTWLTWSATSFWKELTDFIGQIKNIYKWELAVWFWIKEKKHIDFLKWKADYAVIWSEIIVQFEKWGVEGVGLFLDGLWC